MLTIILAFNTIITLFLFSIWKGSNWLNFFLKFVMLAAAVANGLQLLQQLGFLIRVG